MGRREKRKTLQLNRAARLGPDRAGVVVATCGECVPPPFEVGFDFFQRLAFGSPEENAADEVNHSAPQSEEHSRSIRATFLPTWATRILRMFFALPRHLITSVTLRSFFRRPKQDAGKIEAHFEGGGTHSRRK